MIPPSIAAVIDCQTDSKLRTLADVRLIIKDHGGQVTPTAYLFEKKGRVVFKLKDGVGSDELMEPALEAGAVDIGEDDEDGKLYVDTEMNETKAVGDALTHSLGLEVEESGMIWEAKEKVELGSEEEAENLASMIDKLKDVQGVQEVYVNVE
jgi:transcriptional/translational regulatory protein YebC/TACO1